MTVLVLDKMLVLPSLLCVASCRPLLSYIHCYKNLYFYRFIEHLLLVIIHTLHLNGLATCNNEGNTYMYFLVQGYIVMVTYVATY